MFREDDPYRPRLGHWIVAATLVVICSIIIF